MGAPNDIWIDGVLYYVRDGLAVPVLKPAFLICLSCGGHICEAFVQVHRERCPERALDVSPLWELSA